MQVLEAINRMKASMHDVSNEYDDAACIFALNTAVHELAALLIAAHYPDLIEEKDFMDGDMVPEGFSGHAAHIQYVSRAVRYIWPA